MKRAVHALIGVGLTGVGGLLTVGFAAALIRFHDAFVTIFLAAALIAFAVGLLSLTRLAYEVVFSDAGLLLRFVMSTKEVPWSDVESYRKFGVSRGFDRGPVASAGVFIILKYRRLRGPVSAVTRVYFWLTGTGPSFSWSSRDYVTPLDRYIPDKSAG